MVDIFPTKVVLLLALSILNVSNASQADSNLLLDVQRGFNDSLHCIASNRLPSEWCNAFRTLIRQKANSSAAFLLGANLGFSFQSESTAEAIGASEDELRYVAAYATLSRLRYETMKTALKLTDAELITLLRIRPVKFLAWKARAATNDHDRSVSGSTRGITL